MNSKWRIERSTHVITSHSGEKQKVHRWWLIRPNNWPQPWMAHHVGTFEGCCLAFALLGPDPLTPPERKVVKVHGGQDM